MRYTIDMKPTRARGLLRTGAPVTLTVVLSDHANCVSQSGIYPTLLNDPAAQAMPVHRHRRLRQKQNYKCGSDDWQARGNAKSRVAWPLCTCRQGCRLAI